MTTPSDDQAATPPQPRQEPEMRVNMLGCVRATHVPKESAFLPMFEAVVNAIHSTQDRFGADVARHGEVKVIIHRVQQAELPGTGGRPSVSPITSVTITDNGIGFNQANLDSFETAYTTAKAEKGGKGVGRFTWLVVFKEAVVESTFAGEGAVRHRTFKFKPTKRGIEDHAESEPAEPGDLLTKIELRGVQSKYVDALRKGMDVIAERLFEHCFPYFVVGECPKVSLVDECPEGTVRLTINDMVRELTISAPMVLQVGRHLLQARHVQQRHRTTRQHVAHLCAHLREVEVFKLAAVSDLEEEPITGTGGEPVVHHVFVSGAALDKAVDQGRTRLLLAEDDPLFSDAGDLDMKTLRAAVGQHVNEHLSPVLEAVKKANFEQVERHIRTEQPEYRHLLTRKPEDIGRVKWSKDPRVLDESLYRVQQVWEADVRKHVASVEEALTKSETVPDDYAQELERVAGEVNEAGQASLIRYVVKRRAVLKFVRTLMSKKALESQVHRLIFPMKKTGEQVQYDDHNLWLVDDTLSFHEHLASDLTFTQNEVAPVESERRPDLLAFKTGDPPYQHVALLEFKRPERKDDNPVQQIVDYAVLLREGGAKNAEDMTMPGIPKAVRIDAVALATLTPELERKLRTGPGNMVKAEGEWRWYGGVPEENLAIEVLDFQTFVKRAEQRNRAFFVKLGLT